MPAQLGAGRSSLGAVVTTQTNPLACFRLSGAGGAGPRDFSAGPGDRDSGELRFRQEEGVPGPSQAEQTFMQRLPANRTLWQINPNRLVYFARDNGGEKTAAPI